MAFKEGVIIGPISFNATGSANTAIANASNTGIVTIGNTLLNSINLITGTGNITVSSTSGTIALNSTSGPINIQASSTAPMLLSTAGGTLDIFAGVGKITISNDASASEIDIGTGAAVVKTIKIGGTGANIITIGNVQTLGSVAISNAMTTGTLTLGGSSMTGALTLGQSTSGQTVTISSVSSTNTTNINAGTGGIALATATTGTIAINPGTTGALTLGTTSTGNVSVGNTTGTTSIQFGTGSALSTFIDWSSWTPTLVGTVAGATTYTSQFGTYTRIGNLVIAQFRVAGSAATGTGSAVLGGLPFTINNTANYVANGPAIVNCAGWTWPVGSTMMTIQGVINTTTANFTGNGSATSSQLLQMTNAAFVFSGTLMYRV